MKTNRIDPRAFAKLGGMYLMESEHERTRQRLTAEKKQQDDNYILLNNLYLMIERGKVALNLHYSLMLRDLAITTYAANDKTMLDYWQREFEQLPGWNNF